MKSSAWVVFPVRSWPICNLLMSVGLYLFFKLKKKNRIDFLKKKFNSRENRKRHGDHPEPAGSQQRMEAKESRFPPLDGAGPGSHSSLSNERLK